MTDIDIFLLINSDGDYFVCHDEPSFEERLEDEVDEYDGRAYRLVRLRVRVADFTPRRKCAERTVKIA